MQKEKMGDMMFFPSCPLFFPGVIRQHSIVDMTLVPEPNCGNQASFKMIKTD